MFTLLEEQSKAKNDVWATETQVLIASIGKGMVPHWLKVASTLWANGIKAETLYNDNAKP